VRFAAGNIQEIIGSVRMLEAIEQGRIPFAPEPVALGPVLDTLQAIFQERLLEQGITLEVQDGAAQSGPVLAEPHILANHVLNNLVSNAIKFSPSGTKVTIEVEDLGQETRIGVTDQGMGMSPQHLAQLFVPGAPVTRPGARGEKGTGLGLITVRSFAELFGGRLHIASHAQGGDGVHQGTTASIYLKNAVPA
jgi:signal transduction histidine kinase